MYNHTNVISESNSDYFTREFMFIKLFVPIKCNRKQDGASEMAPEKLQHKEGVSEKGGMSEGNVKYRSVLIEILQR